MILAPLLGAAEGFAWLYGSPSPHGQEPTDVRSFRLDVERGRTWAYRPEATVTFFRMIQSP